jgi:hypothetical protein
VNVLTNHCGSCVDREEGDHIKLIRDETEFLDTIPLKNELKTILFQTNVTFPHLSIVYTKAALTLLTKWT